jgi:arylsulfatase A-like enzyme
MPHPHSPTPMRRFAPPKLLAGVVGGCLAGTLWLAGCRSEPATLELADFVDAQRSQVATDRISPAEERGLNRLDSGFRRVTSDDGTEAMELTSRNAALTFYSLAADPATAVELEISVEGKVKPRLRLQLNEVPLKRKRLQTGRHLYRVALPANRLHDGENRLEIGLRPARLLAQRRRPSAVRLYTVSLPVASGRPPRSSGPDEIRLLSREDGTPTGFEMPIACRFDVVARLPRGATLEGAYTLRLRGSGASGVGASAILRISLLDDLGEHVIEEGAYATSHVGELEVDLSEWSGKLARLRFELAGTAEGIWRLDGGRIIASGSPADPATRMALAPQSLEAPPTSGRLRDRRAPAPDVLIVLLDAARADAFSAYGDTGASTPEVDALAAAGTRFTAARSASSWTGQSVPTLFTGLYPDSVGVEHWGSRIPPTVPTLAALFGQAGYRTVLWTQHPFYKSHGTLMGGFDDVIFGRKADPADLPVAEELFGRTLDGAGDRPRAEVDEKTAPVFAVVHLMPPHAPYEPPAPFRGSLTAAYTGHVSLEPTFLNSFPKRRDPASLTPEDLSYIRGRYLENAAYADHLVGRVLDLYRAAGRLDDALVILVSDHGEAFLEHDRFLHGLHLFREYVHVPMIVRWPAGVRGFQSVVDTPASLLDVAPTLVDGLALPNGIGFQGRSLLPVVFDRRALARPLYAYTRGLSDGTRPPRPERRIEADGWVAVLQEIEGTTRLYRASETLEQHDLAAEAPTQALFLTQTARLQEALNRRILETLGAADVEELDAETIEELRALGYLQ